VGDNHVVAEFCVTALTLLVHQQEWRLICKKSSGTCHGFSPCGHLESTANLGLTAK